MKAISQSIERSLQQPRTMDNRRKRKLTFFTIGLIFLLSGVEYGKNLFLVVIVAFALCVLFVKFFRKEDTNHQ